MGKKYLLNMQKFSQALNSHEERSIEISPAYKRVVEYLCDGYSTSSIDFDSFQLSDLEMLSDDLSGLLSEDHHDSEEDGPFHPTLNGGHPIYEYYRVVRGISGIISSNKKSRPITNDSFI